MLRTDTTLWTTPWLRPLNDLAAIDDLLAHVHPTWSLSAIKARVERVTAETPDTTTFTLRPNRNWPGARTGQHLGLTVEIDGVRHNRRYSISSAPDADRTVAITVKRQPDGIVSTWLHDHVAVGDVLALDPPAGDFTLPNPLPTRLLLLSAGSGITPLMAMLRTLAQHSTRVEVAFVHVTRGPAIFARELARRAASSGALALHIHDSTRAGRFEVASLDGLVPDWRERPTLLCGPAPFMTACRSHWRTHGDAALLHTESFGAPLASPSASAGPACEVRCTRSERLFTSDGTTPLLVAAEHGGLRPRYGCRMGICHTCSCVKQSGTVENLRTGAISSTPGERIQLCINRARSDLTLEL